MKILHLEDNPRDAELVHDILAVEWPDCHLTLVSTRADFLAQLALGGFDLILSDYQLPGFNGLEALQLVREQAQEIPFIFISGTLGEERAIETVRAGAADYVIKDRMQRLPLTILRVLRESEELRKRHQIEQALAQEQYLLHLLMESLPDHVYFKDLQSAFIVVNRAKARSHGLTPAQMKGRTDFEVFGPGHAQRAFEDEQQIIRTGQPLLDLEEKVTWPDGSVTWMSASKLPLRDAAGRIVGTFGISRDITARKQSEDRIRELADVIDQTPIAVLITDLTHRVTYCNPGAVALYGLTREQMVGGTAEEFFTAETLERVRAVRQETLATGHWTGEVAVQTKAGRQFQAEFHMALIRDAAGQPRARLSVAIDVTEKRKLEQQFLRAQRLESLGMLAAGIAHDLNNVLAPVLMGAPLLRTRATHPSDLRILDSVEASAGRGAALVRQILSFAHGAGGEKVLIQTKHLLRDITNLIQETFPKNITLEEEVPNNLWTVQGNPTQLHQVLLNLCVNARDAMPKGGTLRLRAVNRTLDAKTAVVYPEANPGAYLVIEVADTGTGIPPEVLTRIWDPFFTTKEEGKGTGLGLVTVRGIAVSHGGFTAVETEVGRGTTFRIFLPAAEPLAAINAARGSAHPALARGQGELLMVVDDEKSIRDMVTAILSRFGYRVVAAANGLEAMEFYAPRVGEIALIVTDLDMPEMGGTDLALAVSRLNPAVKILFMSGAAGLHQTEPLPPEARLLVKPFAGDKLLAAVHEALAAAVGPAA